MLRLSRCLRDISTQQYLRQVCSLKTLQFPHQNKFSIDACFNKQCSTQCQDFKQSSIKWNSSCQPIKTRICDDKKNAIITWENNEQSKFYSLWLRYNCQCSMCKDSTNFQRLAVEKIPMNLTIKDISVKENGLVHVTWDEEESHIGVFTTDFLREHCYSERKLRRTRELVRPVTSKDMDVPSLSWADVNQSDESLYKMLRHTNEKGVCLLTDVPTQYNYVRKVMEKIGLPTGTLYGEVFDVKAKESAINRAYTSWSLHLHFDLCFYETQPGIQFFHCLSFDDCITGGRTTFVDMFHVMEEYREEYPEEFVTLCKVPATFARIHDNRANPVSFVHRKPMVTLNDNQEIIAVCYTPHLYGPPLVTEENVEDYYRAFQLLCRKIEYFPYIRKLRLRPGDLIIANNRRILHGREAYQSNNGARHLQGGYVNVDDFRSKLEVLSRKYDGGRPAHRFGNNDWL